MDISYYIQGLLRQPNRAKAREYLGVEEGVGVGTPGPPGPPGSGDVVGPASAVAGNFASFGDATGKLLADSGTAAANIPTANQKAALAGTYGAPAAGNPYVTDSDPRLISSGGTVTSVGLTAPSILSVAGSPVTTFGSLDLTLANQNANLIFSGPATGAAAAPTMRALVAADLPATARLWDVVIIKSADQVITNNQVPVNDTELVTALDANSFYFIQLILLQSGNDATGDFRGRFSIPTVTAGTSTGFVLAYGSGGAQAINALGNGAAQFPAADAIMAGLAGNNPLTALIQFQLKTEAASGNLQWQFANSAAAVGRTSTTRAGTTLLVKKWFP